MKGIFPTKPQDIEFRVRLSSVPGSLFRRRFVASDDDRGDGPGIALAEWLPSRGCPVPVMLLMMMLVMLVLPEAAFATISTDASAAGTLERESGIESHTLQHFLAKYSAIAEGRADSRTIRNAKQDMKGAIIIVDEASLAGTMQVRDLIRITETLSPSRLVLVGDTKQLDAVDAGVPFRQLQNVGMETAVMDQIMRQRDPDLKAAVLDQLEGAPDKALEKLGDDVLSVPRQDLAETAAKRWLMLDADARERTGLMAPTHALREDINTHIRTELRRDGLIRGEEADITRLDPVRLTTAEKELANN